VQHGYCDDGRCDVQVRPQVVGFQTLSPDALKEKVARCHCVPRTLRIDWDVVFEAMLPKKVVMVENGRYIKLANSFVYYEIGGSPIVWTAAKIEDPN
jgi:hypothetical protein